MKRNGAGLSDEVEWAARSVVTEGWLTTATSGECILFRAPEQMPLYAGRIYSATGRDGLFEADTNQLFICCVKGSINGLLEAMKQVYNLLLLMALHVVAAGCSSSDGTPAGTAAPLEPDRAAKGCFDCTKSEYCMTVKTTNGTGITNEAYFCAPNTCGDDCRCMNSDAERRHPDDCYSSCQLGTHMVFCAKRWRP